MNLSIYRFKPDQGRLTRGVTFWICAALAYFGCRSMYFFMRWPWAQENMMDRLIPIVNLPLNLSLIISMLVFVAIMLGVVWFINRPGTGGLLIETETEMKKVTWPSWNDSFNASIIVLIAVIFFMIFLGIADILLNFVFTRIVFGG